METNVEEKKFGFKGLTLGKSSNKKLEKGVLHEEEVEIQDTDFITGVHGKEIESERKKSKPEEIVIPLQPNSIFRGLKSEKRKQENVKIPSPKRQKNDLDSTAINELIEDAERDNENWENRDLEAPKNLTIAGQENQLNQNESDEDEREETDYEKVPISSFGLAMLRGMGWKEGEGIGTGDRKRVIDPVQAVARPRGLGLGADRSAHQTKNQVTGKSRSKQDDEELVLKKGSFCQITSGKNEDMYGEIIGIDEESARVYVKLTLGESISISEFKIRLVSKTEYVKYSKYINKGKVDKYKEEENRKLKSEEKPRERSERKESRERNERTSERSEKKESREKKEKSDRKEKSLWLRPQLRVRIIDKNFSKGRYFKEKVKILDVMDKTSCQCRTNDGKLLELSQDQLETVIPREGPFVCIIQGRYSGQLGEILERDKSKGTAAVQLLSDRDKVCELSFDHICEYTGDVDADLNY